MAKDTGDVKVWADGYGVWHAEVPAGRGQYRAALDAIRDALVVREGRGYDPGDTKVMLRSQREGRAVYSEL